MQAKTFAAAALALLFALAPAGGAQQPGQDPFNGQFGAMEIALSPRQAAEQQALFQEHLARLAPARRGRTDVFLIAAAFWSDPVFEREASQGAEILSRRLGAQGRTLVLTEGDGGAARAYPAATPYHLNAALGRIGQMIDPDEDLVVLFLTSHGNRDGSIAIRDHNRMGGALRPANLRDALNEAGISNRVVIVSSCYSGAFIAPLMNQNTIVLAASAPSRTSFGCQADREWTYFGDAFLSQSVRGGAGLVDGFDAAKRLIAQWEREQNLEPSNPQKSVGARAAELLARAERNATAGGGPMN